MDAINLHECPVVPATEPRPYCGRSATHTIVLERKGPHDVCFTHAKLHDAGRTLTLFSDAPVAEASNG